MKNKTQQLTSEYVGSARPLYTLKNFSNKHSNFITLPGITNQVFKASPRQSSKGEISGNGMLEFGVIVRIGRKVLIDEAAYFRWLDWLQGHGRSIMNPTKSSFIDNKRPDSDLAPNLKNQSAGGEV